MRDITEIDEGYISSLGDRIIELETFYELLDEEMTHEKVVDFDDFIQEFIRGFSKEGYDFKRDMDDFIPRHKPHDHNLAMETIIMMTEFIKGVISSNSKSVRDDLDDYFSYYKEYQVSLEKKDINPEISSELYQRELRVFNKKFSVTIQRFITDIKILKNRLRVNCDNWRNHIPRERHNSMYR